MEQIVFTIRPALKPIIILYVIVLLLTAIAAAVRSYIGILFGVIAFVTLLEVLASHLQRNFTIYTLTSENIKKRTGVFGKREVTIPLEKIQNVTSDFTVGQRILRIGNVTAETAAERSGGLRIRNINNPEQIAKRILETAKMAADDKKQEANNEKSDKK